MKCEVDINLGGITPTIKNDFYGNPVTVKQVVNCATSISSTISSSTTFTKYKGTCDQSGTGNSGPATCDFLTAKASYEQEFYFFDKFTISDPNCGSSLTYTLRDSSNSNAVATSVAVIDEIALVPGRMRIYLKDASATASHTFTIVGTNSFGV